MLNIICGLVLIIILPSLLIYRVFKSTYTKLKKWLLVPICFIVPNILYFLWPIILTSSGILKVTGDATFSETVKSWASLGTLGTVIWTILTTICVVFFVWFTGNETNKNNP